MKRERQSQLIRIREVSKTYGATTALDVVSLDICAGEFLTLLGPSGSGKTTLLMVLAGFVNADSGSIQFGEEEMIMTAPHKRGVGVVFQNYALFPHMTVAQNIEYPLKLRKVPAPERQRQTSRVLELIQLQGLGGRHIHELSGGQRQRVALARAIVFEPRILLMDEPLSALDKNLREHMQIEIKRLHVTLGTTTVYVTHDQREALTMSDRVAVMDRGRIVQVAAPRQLYDKPVNRFVADFVGESSFIPVRVEEDHVLFHAKRLRAVRSPPLPPGNLAHLVLRPERISLVRNQGDPALNYLPCKVMEVIDQGETILIYVRLEDETDIAVRQTASRDSLARVAAIGEEIAIAFHPDDAVLVPA